MWERERERVGRESECGRERECGRESECGESECGRE